MRVDADGATGTVAAQMSVPFTPESMHIYHNQLVVPELTREWYGAETKNARRFGRPFRFFPAEKGQASSVGCSVGSSCSGATGVTSGLMPEGSNGNSPSGEKIS